VLAVGAKAVAFILDLSQGGRANLALNIGATRVDFAAKQQSFGKLISPGRPHARLIGVVHHLLNQK